MTIAKDISIRIERSKWIKNLFEKGAQLLSEYPEDEVFDFSLGNPVFEPPAKVISSLISLLSSTETGKHRYMQNQGFAETRSYIANDLSQQTALKFDERNIIMTTGAAGALNILFKSICNPEDEVIVFTPYFIDYCSYIENTGAVVKALASTDEHFQINFEELKSAISSKTAAILINSPNNPTGVIYPKSDLEKLGKLLKEKSIDFDRDIYLVADSPYEKIVFDGVAVPSVFNSYDNSIFIYSYSKDLAIPGERIGYMALSPQCRDGELLMEACITSQRMLGYVNAPALFQRLIPLVGNTIVDISVYKTNRDLLYNFLNEIGFKCEKPQGAFYLFPKCPIADDVQFVQDAQELKLLLVPGSGFGRAGYFRISFCVDTQKILDSFSIFKQLAQKYKLI